MDAARGKNPLFPRSGRPPKWLWGLWVLALLGGIYWRHQWVYVHHSPEKHIFSDMKFYATTGKLWMSDKYKPRISDAVRPPGGALVIGWLRHKDPTNRWALAFMFITSALVPVAALWAGWELFGLTVGLIASTMTSLYFVLVFYAGFYLTESPLALGLLICLGALGRCLRMRNAWLATGLALLTGGFMGILASWKSITLLTAACTGLGLAVLCWKYRVKRLIPVGVAMVIGTMAGVAPFAVRCTKLLEGEPCLIGTEASLNFLMGHYGNVRRFWFQDKKRRLTLRFGCPISAAKKFKHEEKLEIGAWETKKLRALAWSWIKKHPFDAAYLSVEHVFDTFFFPIFWPLSKWKWRRYLSLHNNLFWFLVLFPMAILLWQRRRGIVRFRASESGVLVCLLCVVALCLAMMIAKGEPRYRVPFDPIMILMASVFYAERLKRERAPPPMPDDPPPADPSHETRYVL